MGPIVILRMRYAHRHNPPPRKANVSLISDEGLRCMKDVKPIDLDDNPEKLTKEDRADDTCSISLGSLGTALTMVCPASILPPTIFRFDYHALHNNRRLQLTSS